MANIKSSTTMDGIGALTSCFPSTCIRVQYVKIIERKCGVNKTCIFRQAKSTTRSRGIVMTARVPSIRIQNDPLNTFGFLECNIPFFPHSECGLNFWRITSEAAEVVPVLQFCLCEAVQVDRMAGCLWPCCVLGHLFSLCSRDWRFVFMRIIIVWTQKPSLKSSVLRPSV